MTDRVTICECFARDGLQHESVFVPTATKVALIDAFTAAGFPRVEATSYSHPGQVPAFADAGAVLAGIGRGAGVHYKATCPNLRAVERAVADIAAGRGANELSLLVSATEGHTARNLRTTRAEQWARVGAMADAARGHARLVGVVSVAFGCPIEGAVDPGVVAEDAARFAALGVGIVALGDTTGMATPRSVRATYARLVEALPGVVFVAHFHNTRGTGIANCIAALEAGCRWFDTSFGGVGGHPAGIAYGEGMTGNVATEDLVELLEACGVATGIDLGRMIAASRLCEAALGRELHSMVARAGVEGGMNLDVEDRGAVRILWLARPEKLNALDTALTQALHDGLVSADRDEGVRALVLAGRGRAFCAGADLAEFHEFTPANRGAVLARADLTTRTQMLLARIGKPIVSAVQGAAMGGGAGLAIGCDMMVAGTDLKFGYPEMRHSIVPAIVMTGLVKQVGRKAAFELVSLGRVLGAEEVRALGLANRVVPPGEVVEAALEIAGVWAAAHPAAMAATKGLFHRVADLPVEAGMAAGRDVNAIMRGFREP